MFLPRLDSYFQKAEHFLIIKQFKHKPDTACSTTSSGFQNNFVLIDTSCFMKGIIPCNRRIWYRDREKSNSAWDVLKTACWKYFSLSPGMKSRKCGIWENQSICTQRRSRRLSSMISASLPVQSHEAPVISEFSKETEIYMTAFGQWLGNWASMSTNRSA